VTLAAFPLVEVGNRFTGCLHLKREKRERLYLLHPIYWDDSDTCCPSGLDAGKLRPVLGPQ
jgi:hypothetical protein